MPLEVINEKYITSLPQLSNASDLFSGYFEIERLVNGLPASSKVNFATLLQAINTSIAKGNNSGSLYKTVRTYDSSGPNFTPGFATLVDLDPRFLCLGAICYVEFPHPSREYRLVYSPNSSLNVAVDGSFNGDTIGAKWVEKDSLEDQYARITEFNPFAANYAEGDIVKFILDDTLTLFSAKKSLVKATYPDNMIPQPTGSLTDGNWQRIGAGASEGGDAYDDTELRTLIGDLQQDVADLLTNIETAKTALNDRIDGIVTSVIPWASGSYVEGQLVHHNSLVFMARQDIQNSAVAPTATNAYWLLVNGSSSASTSGSTVDLSNYYTKAQVEALDNAKVDKRTGYSLVSDTELQRLAGISNYVLLDNSVTEAKLSPEVRTKLNAPISPPYDDSEIQGQIQEVKTELDQAEANIIQVQNDLDNKVDKVDGLQLSPEQFTRAEKEKLAAMEDLSELLKDPNFVQDFGTENWDGSAWQSKDGTWKADYGAISNTTGANGTTKLVQNVSVDTSKQYQLVVRVGTVAHGSLNIYCEDGVFGATTPRLLATITRSGTYTFDYDTSKVGRYTSNAVVFDGQGEFQGYINSASLKLKPKEFDPTPILDEIQELSDDLGQAENDILNFQNAVQDLETQVADHETRIVSLENRPISSGSTGDKIYDADSWANELRYTGLDWNAGNKTLQVRGTTQFGSNGTVDGSITVAGFIRTVSDPGGQSGVEVLNPNEPGFSKISIGNTHATGKVWDFLVGGNNNAGQNGNGAVEGNLILAVNGDWKYVFRKDGRVGINTNSPHPSATLEIGGSTGGLLIPRLTTAQRDAIASPATSVLIYNTDTAGFQYYDAGWKGLASTGATYDDTALSNRVTVLENKPEPQPFDPTSLQGQIDNKTDKTTTDALAARVTVLENKPEPQAYDDSALDQRVAIVETDLDAVEVDINAVQNEVSDLEDAVDSLDVRVVALENKPATPAYDDTNLKNRVAGVETNKSDKTTVAALDGRVGVLENKPAVVPGDTIQTISLESNNLVIRTDKGDKSVSLASLAGGETVVQAAPSLQNFTGMLGAGLTLNLPFGATNVLGIGAANEAYLNPTDYTVDYTQAPPVLTIVNPDGLIVGDKVWGTAVMAAEQSFEDYFTKEEVSENFAQFIDILAGVEGKVDGLDTRMTVLENKPAPQPFDNTSNNNRLTALETAAAKVTLDFNFAAGYANVYTATITNNTAKTYVAQTLSNVASVVYKVNGSTVTLPFTSAVGNTLEITITRTNTGLGSIVTINS